MDRRNEQRYDAQLALLVSEPPSGRDWIHELKLDGYRIGVLVEDGAVRLMSRRGKEWTAEFPALVAAAKQLPTRDVVLDGEVVMLSEQGISSFEALQNRARDSRSLAYFAFDLLSLDGNDVSRLPLIERKRALQELIGDGVGIIKYTHHFDDPGPVVLRQACRLGAEGIVSKRRDAAYRWGARHDDWQKSKCTKRQEFVVGGFTDPSGSRVGVGSMLIGYYEGDDLRFAGKVGTGRGWGAKFGVDLREKLERIATKTAPFNPKPPGWLGRNAHWVKPKYVVEVEFTEWTAGGHVRHPSLQGFREDKDARDVVRERPVDVVSDASRPAFPRIGISRDDLVALYTDIADWVLPHVLNRPLTIVRCKGPVTKDDALRSQCTFVRHTSRDNAWAPRSVPRLRITEKRKIGEYLYVSDLSSLLALIEHGAVEWHVWNATVDDIEHPDRIVFDLDPGDGATWVQIVDAARRVRAALRTLKLESWVKTTGGRGVHVVVPFQREHGWDDVFAFSRAIAETIASADPDSFTTSFDKADRIGKVLIDYKRNYRTSIAVAGFSTRARPNGSLSVPIAWRELGPSLRPDQFTVANIRERLRRRTDPWADLWPAHQRLPL
jgi:bifunctional non-homologous end joining protein LigD